MIQRLSRRAGCRRRGPRAASFLRRLVAMPSARAVPDVVEQRSRRIGLLMRILAHLCQVPPVIEVRVKRQRLVVCRHGEEVRASPRARTAQCAHAARGPCSRASGRTSVIVQERDVSRGGVLGTALDIRRHCDNRAAAAGARLRCSSRRDDACARPSSRSSRLTSSSQVIGTRCTLRNAPGVILLADARRDRSWMALGCSSQSANSFVAAIRRPDRAFQTRDAGLRNTTTPAGPRGPCVCCRIVPAACRSTGRARHR